MADIIQQRRDTAARWAQYNPILLEGEVGYVTDNPNQYKIGNGRDRWNDLPFRGYTGTITQDTGDDENAVMSQKATTEKLAELGSKVGANTITDNLFVNGVVKELYLYREDGKGIVDNYIISTITKNATATDSGDANIYSIVVSDINANVVCALYNIGTIGRDNIVVLQERNNSGIKAYAIINFDSIADGWYSGLNAMINSTAYSTIYNPTIYSYFLEGRFSGKIKEIENENDDILSQVNSNSKDIDRAEFAIKSLNEGSRIEDENYIDADVVITEGYYLAKDGVTVVENAAFQIAEINIANAAKIKVVGTHFAQGCTLCFKDANGNIIGDIVVVSETAYSTVEENVPMGCAKAYTTYRYNGLSDEPRIFQVVRGKTLNDFAKSVKYNEYQSFYDVTQTIEIVNGLCNLSDGTTTTNAAFGKSGRFNVVNYDSIRIYNRVVKNICYAKWFDAEGNEVLPRGNGDDSGERKYVVYEKPSGAVSVEVSVIDWSRGDYIIEGGVNNNSQLTDNNGLLQQDIKNIPNVSMIPIFGQSLSVGAAATPVISVECKYNAGIMFATGIAASQQNENYFTEFVPLQERDRGVTNDSAGSGETVASGCLEQLIELIQRENGINAYSNFWNNHKFLFVTCGSGSKTIADLMSGYYQGLINSVKGGKNVAVAKGWSFHVPAVIYIQGETDQKNGTSYSEYKQSLENFAERFNVDVKSITGQIEDAKVILYQTASQNIVVSNKVPTYTNNAMDIPTAQMELVRDNDMFVACNPTYMLDHSEEEPIHLSAVGEKMMGLYIGKSLKRIICKENHFKGLTPSSFTVNGNDVVVKHNVPCVPIKTNTSFVKEVDKFGYAVINEQNINILSEVEVFDDTVILRCSENPSKSKVYYGLNGVSGKDGRIDGARGNICDSSDCVYSGNIGNRKYVLSNYCYSYAVILE